MSESEHPPKNKKVVRNIIYSFLVFYGSSFVFFTALDRKALNHPSIGMKLNAKDFLAIGLSIAAAVAFYRWFGTRNNRERGFKA